MSLKSLVISFPHPYRILFLLSLPRFDSLWAVAPLTLLTFFHSPQYMLASLSAPSCCWQSSPLQYLLNFFQSPSFPPPPLPVPENSLILFLKMYSLPIAFARSPSPPPRKQKSPSAAAQRIMRADDWWSLPPPLPNHFCFSFLWIPLSLAAKVVLLVTRLFITHLGHLMLFFFSIPQSSIFLLTLSPSFCLPCQHLERKQISPQVLSSLNVKFPER